MKAVLLILPLSLMLGCDPGPELDEPETTQQAQMRETNPGEGGRCAVTRDSDGRSMGEGTVDSNGFCCVTTDCRTTCYGCGSGYSCSSLPDERVGIGAAIILRAPTTALAR